MRLEPRAGALLGIGSDFASEFGESSRDRGPKAAEGNNRPQTDEARNECILDQILTRFIINKGAEKVMDMLHGIDSPVYFKMFRSPAFYRLLGHDRLDPDYRQIARNFYVTKVMRRMNPDRTPA